MTFPLEANVKPGEYLLLFGAADHQDFWRRKDGDVYSDWCEAKACGDLSRGSASIRTANVIERIGE